MHSTHKILLVAAALVVSPSLGQRLNASVCASSQAALLADAPVLPTALQPYLSALTASLTTGAGTTTPPPSTLEDPEGYVALICGIAGAIPADAQPDFASYGASLLSHANFHLSAFDDFVTDCVTEGPAATSITDYLNHLVTATENLCQATPTPTPTPTPSSSSSSVPVVGAGEGACPAPTLSSSSSSSSSSSPSSSSSSSSDSPSSTLPVTAGASRLTGGVFAGAAALGGLLGAVALL